MFLVVEENPNCEPDERVFSEFGEKHRVLKALINNPDGNAVWCDATGVDNGGHFNEVLAVRVNDSSDGTAWLLYGSDWGVRFRPEGSKEEWSLNNKNQWGAPFKVLDESALAFAPSSRRKPGSS